MQEAGRGRLPAGSGPPGKESPATLGAGRIGTCSLAGVGNLVASVLAPPVWPLIIPAFLVGRTTVLQSVSPFGLALYAAVLAVSPGRAAAVALAVLSGTASTGSWVHCLEFAGAALGLLLLRAAFGRQARPGDLLVTPALAFTVTAISGGAAVLLREPTPYGVVMALFGALLTFVLCLLYQFAVPLLLSGRRPTGLGLDQTVALSVTLAGALAGLAGWGDWSAHAAGSVTGVAVLAAAYLGGAGTGTAAATAMGVVAALCGAASLSSLALRALAGLLAGSFREWGRGGAAAGYFFGTLLLSPLIEEAFLLRGAVLDAAAASVLFLLTPGRLWGTVRRSLSQPVADVSGDAPSAARESAGRRLLDLGQVFDQLASTLRELSAGATKASATTAAGPVREKPAGEGAVLPMETGRGSTAGAVPLEEVGQTGPPPDLVDAACRVCQACRLLKSCWKGDLERVRGAMAGLLQITTQRGQLEVGDVPVNIRRRCVHLGEMVTTMNFLHEVMALHRYWRRRLDETRSVVYQQLEGMARLMRRLGETLQAEATDEAAAAETLARHLERAGFPVLGVRASRSSGGPVEFLVRAGACSSGDACREVALPVASTCAGGQLALAEARCALAAGEDECSFRLEVPRRLDFKMGVAQAKKPVSLVSGDSYLVRELPGHRLAAVLSDGTGAGPRAAEESRTALRMLEGLFSLGLDTEAAVHTVNTMLLLRAGQERFATLDLVTVDLRTGQARFVKVGASPSYLKRGREVSVIHASSLPLGVLPEVGVEERTLALRPGDVVVLATDGLVAAGASRSRGAGPHDGW
ncbi:MAG: SpoIIE family protein phosphatase, partial [Firmicutes bacterium]|nr:SpoIIE family protein phosphatase [Bacillota bacterium]